MRSSAAQPDAADSASVALVCTDLVVRFGSVTALDRCSVTLPERGTVSIIGENGSGKSTLLDVLSGFLRPASGRVTDGAGRIVSRAVLRRTASRLHQRVVLPPELTVHEYLSICADASVAARPTTPRTFFERFPSSAEELVREFLGIHAEEMNRTIAELSWGQQRIVAACGILATRRPFVLLDEPFAGIAAPLRKSLMDLLLRSARTQLVVFSEHDLRYAARAERIVVLKAGTVANDVPAKDFPEMDELMRLYGE